MLYTPHKYQEEAIAFLLARRFAGLFLDMGLGKTSICLYAARQLIQAGHVKKILLIGPHRALSMVWPKEIERWDIFRSMTYHNLHESRLNPIRAPDATIHAINPESALKYMRSGTLYSPGYDLLIIDESADWKSHKSQRFKALKNGLDRFKYRWILTGTPRPNAMADLWSQIFILDQGAALGGYITHFRNKYCFRDRSGFNYIVPPPLREVVYQRISHLVLRMSARDNIDMPELIHNQILVKLPADAMITYKDMEKKYITILKDGTPIASPNAAVAGGRCRQIANGGLYKVIPGTNPPKNETVHIHDAKTDALKEIVEGLNGTPLLVFYEFNHDEERIQAAIGPVPNLTTSKDAASLVAKFNAGEIPVLLGHPKTVGVGLNLQGACYNVLWMCPPWDMYLHDQANARVFRQGQQAERVLVHYLVAEKTMDVEVLKVLAGKQADQEELFAALVRYSNSL
jgi:hypothetical protein